MWVYLSLVVLIASYVLYYRFFHALAKVPGPFAASLSNLWLAKYAKKLQRQREDLKLHDRYGPLVRVGPDEVMFSNPDYFKSVYGAASKFRKGRWYETSRDPAADHNDTLNLFSETNLDRLRMQKRLVGPLYSVANMRNHEKLIDSAIADFLLKMADCSNQPIDINRWLELFCIDMFTELTYSNRMGAVQAESDNGHMQTLDGFERLIAWLGTLPTLNSIMQTLIPHINKLFQMGIDLPVYGYCKEQIERIRSSEKESGTPSCLYSDLLHVSNTRPEFKPHYAQLMSITNLGAGIDTTTWTLASTLVLAMQNTAAKERLVAELEDAVKSGVINSHGPVPYDQAAKLPYLQACIQEAQRLMPSIGMPLQRLVPASGIIVEGHYLPPGTAIGMNPWVFGRSEAIFGLETDRFKPERWLNTTSEQKRDMDIRNLAFGGPSRICPGMYLALVCMSKFIATLLRDFDVEVLNKLGGPPGSGGRTWIEYSAFVTKWEGCEVRLSKWK